jgi:lipoate-protein ligase A
MNSEKISAASETWWFLQSGLGAPADNMAIDEALLEAASRLLRPILRFYGWSEPAVTFGYSQKLALIEGWTSCRPLIRRPTGGGLVSHEHDWTYSLIIPPLHPWYALNAKESYRRAHEWVHRAFDRLQVSSILCASPIKEVPGRCFLAAEVSDLLRNGQKIAGAAQRRNKHGLLIQGSVQPAGLTLKRTAWERAMISEGEGLQWEALELDGPLRARAAELAKRKYSNVSYNSMR